MPVTIIVGNHEAELTITGEKEVCLRSVLAEITIALRFMYPYYGPGDTAMYWETKPVSLPLTQGTPVTEVLLCTREQDRGPGWDQTGWHDMWVLSPPADKAACGAEYLR